VRGGAMTLKQDFLLLIAGFRIALHKLLQRIFGGAPEVIDWTELKVLCLGLDGAGKTALVRVAVDASATFDGQEPTAGFNVRTAVIPPNLRLDIWEIGGAANIRPFWPQYAKDFVNGLIWVVDSANAGRFAEAATALEDVLQASVPLRQVPLLVLATKVDLSTAQNAEAIESAMRLADLQRRGLASGVVKVLPVSASDAAQVVAALRWLQDCLNTSVIEPIIERT
jgi:GTPase SAR1 family protein